MLMGLGTDLLDRLHREGYRTSPEAESPATSSSKQSGPSLSAYWT